MNTDDFTVTDSGRFLSVDLSELAFIGRLLGVANDGGLELRERIRFLALVSEALDEFFQTRMGALHQSARDDGDARRTLVLVRSHVDGLLRRQDRIFHAVVIPRLAEHGVRVLRWASLDEHERAIVTEQFRTMILPVLGATPLLTGDDASRVPDLDLCLLASVGRRAPITQAAIVLPPTLPRLVGLSTGAFVRIEDVIAAHRDDLARQLGWSAVRPFRVTRHHDDGTATRGRGRVTPADPGVLDLTTSGPTPSEAVRLEVHATMPGRMRDRLARELGLARVDVYELVPFLETGLLWALEAVECPSLPVAARMGVTPAAFRAGSAFEPVRAGDVAVHHPYESFDTTVLAMVEYAASDPSVVAIRQTLPPLQASSPLVAALVAGARNGKHVDVVIARPSRLGETGDLSWAGPLRALGARVVEAPDPMRVHAKVSVVVRRDDAGTRSYVHVGTGNYDEVAARHCEDVSLFTSQGAVAMAVHDVFDALLAGERPDVSALAGVAIVSPAVLRQRLLALILDERRAPERSRQIILKLNHLGDPEIVDALYAASNDGVQVDVVVRGRCLLRPGVPGVSDRIRVRSVVGPVLEHSRIFAFGAGSRARWFLGSADLLPAAGDDRVEFVVPVDDETVRDRLREIVSNALLDDANAWQLRPDGSWHRTGRRIGVDGQAALLAAARERAASTESA